MMPIEYFAAAQHQRHERELARDLERRRIRLERIGQSVRPARHRGFRVAAAGAITRLHDAFVHQPVRG